MNNKDLIIRDKLQKDKQISDKADKIFNNFKEEFRLENNEGRKVIKISFSKFLAIAASFVIILFLGVGLYTNQLKKNDSIQDRQALIGKNDENIKLENYVNSEIGISFNYPKEWKYVDNNHGSGVVMVGLEPNSNEEHNENICLYASYSLNNEKLNPKQCAEKNEKYKEAKKEGYINIAGNEGYYFETKRTEYDINKSYENKETTIYVGANSLMYTICFYGDEDLYNIYYKTYEKILETVKFSEPEYIEERNFVEDNNEEKEVIGNNEKEKEALEGNEKNIELTNYINSEIGVSFYYPGDWTEKDNNHGSGAVGVWLNKESNEKHIENVFLWIAEITEDEKLSSEEYAKKNGNFTQNSLQGKTSVAGNDGYYIENKEYKTAENNTIYEYVETKIYVKTNYTMYEITFSGDKNLYDKYHNAFRNVLDSIKFNKPTY